MFRIFSERKNSAGVCVILIPGVTIECVRSGLTIRNSQRSCRAERSRGHLRQDQGYSGESGVKIMGDLRLSGPPSRQGVDVGSRTHDRRFPADLRADSLATVPSTPRRY
ncbi:hypothetical protein PoB_002283400 [Plakobranchus ocellatus]|uniref:Uncharacterized protein n=1 Tax=Plakobranchus ocellatus TaxID=259542 RepID=A0AAV3ZLY7_9GAST|nr:hypothetical protein PoB_002283400 [Plakobranchus ocellatus]